MTTALERKLVTVVRRALSAGPVPQDELLTAVRQAGLPVDIGRVWMTCTTHGLADLQGEVWMPRGWAAPVADALGTVERPPARAQHRVAAAPGSSDGRVSPRVAAEVRQLTSALRLPAFEPVAPSGPVPGGWADVVAGASRALADELHAVTSRRTLTDVPLSGGNEAAKDAKRRLMRFEAEGELGVAEGTAAVLVVEGEQFEVEVVSVFGNIVTLSMPPSAPLVRDAVLRFDLSWLLTSQRRRLQELAQGGPGFDAAAALAIVSPDHAQPPGRRPALAEDEVRGLNDGQRGAVELALTHGVTWLWGPPGTGKTTSVAALVAALCARGKRVLLTAPTNAALDVAVQALLKRLPHLVPGTLVRLGQPADQSLVKRAAGHVLVDEIAAIRGELLATRRMDVGQQLRDYRQKLAPLKRRHGKLTAEEETTRLGLEAEIAELTDLTRELDQLLQIVRRQVCREATVVAATAHQVVLDTLKELTFDVVVLDEASMTTAALAPLVAGAGCGHTIVAGDFRQLPPVAIADTSAAQQWLHRSPFEKAGIDTAVAGRRPPARLAALTEQYRMHQPISDAVSAAFYPERPLITARGVSGRTRRSRAAWASSDLVVLDTSGLAARTARRQGMFSRYNLMHAQLVAALLGTATDAADLGLISPFAPQARLLESLLPETRLEEWAASTVHRFQGGERDIIIYDTVDTGYGVPKLHRWFTEGEAGGQGARLLDVAASRARDHLVFVAAVKRLYQSRGPRDAVSTFFAHLLDQADRLPWQAALSSSASTTEQVNDGIVHRLADDIARSATVEMWLPGTAPLPGLRAILPALRQVPAPGSGREAVTVWVEPGNDGYLSDEAMQAKREGINIRACTPILESSAVVGDVVWSSAASLLGTNPGVALRTEHASFADAVRRAQRRRGGPAPGSGQPGEDCGRCRRTMIRFELRRRGGPDIRYECAACDRTRTRR